VRRKKIARTSRTPGRTREINFFDVNGRFVLADLPGYGYAKVSAEARATWRPLIERYIRNNRALRGVVLLFDVRRDPSPDDLDMIDLLGEVEVPVLAVVTKVDKLSAARASERIQAVRRTLGIDAEQVVPYSSVTGEGRDELATAILAIVGEAGS
jgi:GTP-binding protein